MKTLLKVSAVCSILDKCRLHSQGNRAREKYARTKLNGTANV